VDQIPAPGMDDDGLGPALFRRREWQSIMPGRTVARDGLATTSSCRADLRISSPQGVRINLVSPYQAKGCDLVFV
jgi:hypothetical protein